MIDPNCKKCWPNHCVHGEQSITADDLELDRLRTENASLKSTLQKTETDLVEARTMIDIAARIIARLNRCEIAEAKAGLLADARTLLAFKAGAA